MLAIFSCHNVEPRHNVRHFVDGMFKWIFLKHVCESLVEKKVSIGSGNGMVPKRWHALPEPIMTNGLCAGNSPKTGELSDQMASNTENVSI